MILLQDHGGHGGKSLGEGEALGRDNGAAAAEAGEEEESGRGTGVDSSLAQRRLDDRRIHTEKKKKEEFLKCVVVRTLSDRFKYAMFTGNSNYHVRRTIYTHSFLSGFRELYYDRKPEDGGRKWTNPKIYRKIDLFTVRKKRDPHNTLQLTLYTADVK